MSDFEIYKEFFESVRAGVRSLVPPGFHSDHIASGLAQLVIETQSRLNTAEPMIDIFTFETSDTEALERVLKSQLERGYEIVSLSHLPAAVGLSMKIHHFLLMKKEVK